MPVNTESTRERADCRGAGRGGGTRTRWLLALLLLALIGCGSPEDRSEEARERFAEALWRDDVAGALRAYDDLHAALPDTAESRLELARLLGQAGETALALALLEESRKRFPEDANLHLAYAEAALGVGDPSTALEALAELPVAANERLEAILLRARANVAIGDLAAGLETLEVAEASDHPEAIAIRAERIGILTNEQRHEEVLTLLRETLMRSDLEPEQRRAFELLRASTHASSGRPDRALELLDAMLGERPLDPEVWTRRAAILIREGRVGDLREELRQALDAHPVEGGGLFSLLATAEIARGDVAAAEAALRAQVETAPSVPASASLAKFLHHVGRSAEGAALLGEEVARLGGAAPAELAYLHVAMRISAGELDPARAALAAFHRSFPGDPRGEYLRARMELFDGDSEAAARRLVRLAPRLDRSDVQHWLGVAFERSGDLEGAGYRYALAVSRNADQIPSHLGAIRVFEQRGEWDLAEQFARGLIRRAPGSVEAFEALARALGAQGKQEAAQQVLKSYGGRFPGLPGPVVALSASLRAQGDAAAALVELDSHGGIFNSAPDFVAERSVVLGKLGRDDEAWAGLERALSYSPEHAGLLRARAYLLFRADRGDEAIAEVERLLERLPSDATPLRMAGDYWSMGGQFERASEAYERALAIRPFDAQLLLRLGVARQRLGDDDGAIEAYRRAAEVDARAPAPRNNLALLLAEKGRIDEALPHAQAAWALAPTERVAMETLARLYLEKGLAARAAALLERAAAAAPDSAEGRELLERARREVESAGDLPPAEDLPAREAPRESVRDRLARIDRPNIVLVVVDTLRADWISPYGFDPEISPELQRWADAGVVFERVRAQSSWTKVSMASFFTSLWPQRHGIRLGDDGLAEGAVTLAELLRDAGYRTYAVQSNGWLEQSFGFHQGFDHYVFPRALGRPGRARSPAMWPHGERVLREGVRLLEAHASDTPFFLYLHFMDVHEYAAPPEFKRFGGGKLGAYRAAIRWMDDLLEDVRRVLERAGVDDRSVLVLASDHGEAFGENGAWGHARNVFTPVLEVPLVIRFPFPIEPRRVRAQVRNLDVAPTLLEIAGIPAPEHFDGASLLPLVDGEGEGADRATFAALGDPIIAGAKEQVSMNDGRWSLARNLDGGGREFLFDRRLDPREDANLLELEPEAARRMRERLDAHLALAPREQDRISGVRIDPEIAERLRAVGYLGVGATREPEPPGD